MYEDVKVPEDIKQVVNEIILKYCLDPQSKITYGNGFDVGDGYLSRSYNIDITSNKEVVHMFLKCALNMKFPEGMKSEDLYTNEIQFYELIIPTYMQFLKEKNIENGFRNIPKCYTTSNKNILALENLKAKGYTLCDIGHIANDEHINLVFKTYAKFHAISFSHKAQKRGEYEHILRNITDMFYSSSKSFKQKRHGGIIFQVDNFIKSLDPINDKFIFDKREYILDQVIKFDKTFNQFEIKNSVITHGDCWYKNMLFLYKGNKKVPNDVMLVDWQIVRSSSPVFDLSYFFYTVASASKITLCKFKYFLKIYHKELSEQIRRMGSDPETLYPFSTLEEEWKKFCLFSYSMSFMITRAMLYSKDEVPNLEEIGFENIGQTFTKIKRHDEYTNRLRNLTYHFLQNNLI